MVVMLGLAFASGDELVQICSLTAAAGMAMVLLDKSGGLVAVVGTVMSGIGAIMASLRLLSHWGVV